ncbi:Utrophin [Oryzias melastigma]|uniref:Utrophin n=1 Tax=Oryzias melastigma TaxID=30732 RepID=A0A834FEG6_ORYME|nr:Utrophin [Oryzias melastigma]
MCICRSFCCIFCVLKSVFMRSFRCVGPAFLSVFVLNCVVVLLLPTPPSPRFSSSPVTLISMCPEQYELAQMERSNGSLPTDSSSATGSMDDEHALIIQYCQTLGGEGSPSSQPQSPAQILQAVEKEERGELEKIIARLEEEQRTLQREYELLKEQHGQRGVQSGSPSEASSGLPDEADLLAEAKLLRQHKGRLEDRMHILENHNKQLENQLHRLRQLLHQPEVDSRPCKVWLMITR